MYIVNNKTNRITPLEINTFTNLGFRERQHLQEWLAHQPNALGEDLLIIQKEFAGFDNTKERLDLLALDKEGNLVIIENKLDDSGRDVVWQVIKYASYCANLTKTQIIEIYQQYIQKQSPDQFINATTEICEFLDVEDLDEVNLNQGNSQRLILVSAKFRKEVTNSALWLLSQGINIQCFTVTPYSFNENIFINIDQIIPPPETEELMIGIRAKTIEEKSTEKVRKNRYSIRLLYWEKILNFFQENTCTLYNNVNPTKDNALCTGSGISGCYYCLIFLQKGLRVELWISRSSTEENKFIFDNLLKYRNEIENSFGNKLEWQRLDEKKLVVFNMQFNLMVLILKSGTKQLNGIINI